MVEAVRSGQSLRAVARQFGVSPATVRAFEAGGEGLELIAVGSDRPEGGDGVRSESVWID